MSDLLTPFLRSAEIAEISKTSSGTYKALIKASTEKRDEDGDVFLSEAWTNTDDIDYFMRKGVIDYNHLSQLLRVRRGSPAQIAEGERAALKAIIGQPTDMDIDKDVLFCKSELYAENAYVQEMLPALKANSDRFGASVGGGAYKPSEMTKSKYGDRTFDRARLNHIAICPLMEAKNDETHVALMKSMAVSMGISSEPESEAGAAPEGEGGLVSAEGSSLMEEISKSFLHAQPGFMDHLYGVLKSKVVYGDRMDHAKAREFFKGLGMSDEQSEQLATEAVIHFARG